MIVAAKCAPEERILVEVARAGLAAVELYLNQRWLQAAEEIVKTCQAIDLRYALHAPTDCHLPGPVAALAKALRCKVVVFHDIYWLDEWREIAEAFAGSGALPCVENIGSLHEPMRVMRRFGFGRCLDFEHFQMQVNGVFASEFGPFLREASHVHLTGYVAGGELWHTHIHRSPEHCTSLLNMLRDSGYSGLVVSEASTPYQTLADFKGLKSFFDAWAAEQA
ncbi:MAG: hypothetical protein AB1814_03065 [Thermodesulfobacteriota bacterium]